MSNSVSAYAKANNLSVDLWHLITYNPPQIPVIPHGSPLEVGGHEIGLCQEQGRSDLVALEDLRRDDEHPRLRAHLDLATLLGEVVGSFRVGDRRFGVA